MRCLRHALPLVAALLAAPAVRAQAPATPPAAAPAAAIPLRLEAGIGRLLRLPAPAATIMAADPRVARVQPASPTSVFVIGVAAGRTTILATAEDGSPVVEWDVTVRGDTGPAAAAPAAAPSPRPADPAAVQSAIRRLVRGAETVEVRAIPGGLLVTGSVPTPADAERAAAIARGQAGEEAAVQLDLEVLSSIQVNLRVRVAEVSRQMTRDLGFNWQALASTGDFIFGLRTGASAGPVSSLASTAVAAGAGAPSRLGFGVRTSRLDVNAIIDALATDQLISILAEPNLTAQSGETASFLAGGEFPIPVAATVTGNITIEFKPFGVGLSFVPTVLGPGRLNLRVRPEVSELSDNGAITVPLATGTVTIPALTVRRAETTVELGSGQSFAIAGLLQRSSTQAQDGVAGLGEVPVLGALFRSDRFRRQETELVIIVTPYLVRPVSDPRRLGAPTDGFRPATDLDRFLRRRQIQRGAPPPPPALGRLDAGFLLD
jgi:pilus assembly protein CpaC